ncbi:MAG: DUF6575 domain-containing protein [bacterium]|nr:DUF6575 domain-containing protein [bacterium]
MSVLAKNTYLGKLELVEVFEYYDKPILFACRSASGQLYLVVQENDYDEYETWLYCSLSNTRFQQIRSGGIDLYNAFKLAEDDFVFLVKLFYNADIDSEITPIPVAQLEENQLPKPNVFINVVTETL